MNTAAVRGPRGWQRRWWLLLQGLEDGARGPDVCTEVGYEPSELCNHGGIHDLVGRLVWWKMVVWI
jgi:hypothetical protein